MLLPASPVTPAVRASYHNIGTLPGLIQL